MQFSPTGRPRWCFLERFAAKYAYLPAALILLVAIFPWHRAGAGETLARVQSRRLLNCGVSDGRGGFPYQDAKGHWLGLDADVGAKVWTVPDMKNDRRRIFAFDKSRGVK